MSLYHIIITLKNKYVTLTKRVFTSSKRNRHAKGRIQIEDDSEEGAEENIWT
jgi:hypothetical protein